MHRRSSTAIAAAAALGAGLASAPAATAAYAAMPDAYFAADSGQQCRVTGWLSGSLTAGTTVPQPYTANKWLYFASAYCPIGSTTTSLSLTLRLMKDGRLVSRPNPDSTWEPLPNGPKPSTLKVASVGNLRGWPGTGAYQACADIKRWATQIQSTCTPVLK